MLLQAAEIPAGSSNTMKHERPTQSVLHLRRCHAVGEQITVSCGHALYERRVLSRLQQVQPQTREHRRLQELNKPVNLQLTPQF